MGVGDSKKPQFRADQSEFRFAGSKSLQRFDMNFRVFEVRGAGPTLFYLDTSDIFRWSGFPE